LKLTQNARIPTRDESEKQREYGFFEIKSPGKVLIQYIVPEVGREHLLEPEISSIVSTTLEESLRGL